MTTRDGRVGWGLVGASDIASRFMIGAIRSLPDSDVVAVASRSAGRAAEYARVNAIPRHYGAVEALLADPGVDAVYISSDNRLHGADTIAAAGAGKPVLCEKPLAMSVAEGAAMIAACRSAGVVLGTNHHLRTAPAIVAMRRLVVEGRVGHPLAARIAHLTRLPEYLRTWRVKDPAAGGGPLNDMGTHDFDALRFVLGGDVREVTGMTSVQGFAAPGIEDQVMAILGLDGGALASLHAAYNLGFGSSAFDVHGTEGSLIGRTVLSATGGAELVLRTAAGERTIDLGPPRVAYEGTVEAFNAAVRGQGAPAASGVDGLRSIAIASAVRESAREGKTVPVLSTGDSTPGEER